jgi:hypothetical protein
MGFRTEISYNHYSSVELLSEQKHKIDDSSAIYMDLLLFNYEFSCTSLYDHCKFIYFIREAKPTLNKIIEDYPQYKPETALKYYCFRLRRICEMAKRTPNCIVLTWEDLHAKRGLNLLEEYLNLKDPLKIKNFERVENVLNRDLINKGQDSFERHLYYLKKLPNVNLAK